MIARRELLACLFAGPALWSPRAAADAADERQQAVAGLERRHGGRLGVAVHDSAGGELFAYRGDERFPLCSTFKFLAAAFVLARVDRHEESLERRIVYAADRLVPYSPITEKHVGPGGLSLGEICAAAVTLSDNTAGNLMLDSFGGPPALTAHLRTLGDDITRLDRREPDLNEARPGDPRDTTSPAAMVAILRLTVLGTALSTASRDQLAAWLVACKTGDKRLRAGVPKDWRVGDKTGAGANNTTNDIAVLWPPGRPPIIVAAYYTGASGADDERGAVLAEVGRLAASTRA